MSSEKVDEAKESEDTKPAPLQSVLKSKSKDALNEETIKSKRVVFQEKPVIINKIVTKNIDSLKNEGAEVDKQKDKKDRSRPPTKVVVRRLPPTMTLDVFVEYVSPMPDHDFIYFVPADMSLGSNAFARVYINFVDIGDLITFHEQFDNYVFMDNKGNEYPAVVEFAQFQRIPKKRQGKKRDLKAGTLKDDAEYNAFLEVLREKREASATKQTIDVTVPPDKPAIQITTTPLLEYIKHRRAEQQKLRDERREERRRKELERKRVKDEEKKRRKDAESILKVLRSHDVDDHEDSKSGKDSKEKDWSPSPPRAQSSKRREDEKIKQREEKKKERPVLESRTREVKNRESATKSYRDERQKLAEGRIQRKLADDQRKKGMTEKKQSTNKEGDTVQNPESEKPVSSKDTHVRKNYVKDVESKRHSSERHNAKDEKNIKDSENRRNYRDHEGRRHDKYTHAKDSEHKKSTYNSEHRKSVSSGNDSESRKKLTAIKTHEKEVRTKQIVDVADENVSTSSPVQEIEKDEENIESLPSSGKSDVEFRISEETTHQQNIKISSLKRSSSVGSNTRSTEEGKIIINIKTNAVQPLKRSSSLDFSRVSVVGKNKESSDLLVEHNISFCNTQNKEDASKKSICMENSDSYENENTDEEIRDTTVEQSPTPECNILQQDDRNIKSESDSENHEDKNETEGLENEGSQHNETDTVLNAAINEEPIEEGSQQKEHKTSNDTKETNNTNVSSVSKSANVPSNSSGSENKRDPRVERRIRNKDRPSIEIYRPGMGRFSMQRKEREKSAVTSSSSIEQDSPSTSPSPSPALRPISANRSRSGQEFRSMTFKRSVSREK